MENKSKEGQGKARIIENLKDSRQTGGEWKAGGEDAGRSQKAGRSTGAWFLYVFV